MPSETKRGAKYINSEFDTLGTEGHNRIMSELYMEAVSGEMGRDDESDDM